jgi:hypothetical protein
VRPRRAQLRGRALEPGGRLGGAARPRRRARTPQGPCPNCFVTSLRDHRPQRSRPCPPRLASTLDDEQAPPLPGSNLASASRQLVKVLAATRLPATSQTPSRSQTSTPLDLHGSGEESADRAPRGKGLSSPACLRRQTSRRYSSARCRQPCRIGRLQGERRKRRTPYGVRSIQEPLDHKRGGTTMLYP